jgi:hypothetical protein
MFEELPENNLPTSEALEAVGSESVAEQRRDLQEKIFQASDLLEATEKDFAQREALRNIFSAASRLLDADGFMPLRRNSWAIKYLTDALTLLRKAEADGEVEQ